MAYTLVLISISTERLELHWCWDSATLQMKFGIQCASNQGDCDYTSCGSSYPEAVIDVEAARITSPATLSLNSTVLADRDGDSNIDTAEIEFNVLSNAFFEDLDVLVEVKNASGVVLDTLETESKQVEVNVPPSSGILRKLAKYTLSI